MSAGEQDRSGLVGLTHPSLRQTRQQCLSTGNTGRPSEYIITHLAVFFPTPGREANNASHSLVLAMRSGASVT